jgi:cytoplasmic iron level regulating protein YaaA (DUF328/UPF0246 family)
MAGFSILLPPSVEKQSGGNSLAPKMFDRRSSNTFNYFVGLNPERRQVIEAVHSLDLSPAPMAKALGVNKDDLDDALATNEDVMTSPLMSALDRYSPGVMYSAMDFENLPTGAQRRLLEHGVIVSSMFGLLRPDDLVPEYYCSFDAKLPEIGKIKEFWRPFVSESLNQLVKGHFVWNLLPASLQPLWASPSEEATIVTVEFYRKKRGGAQQITEDLDALIGGFVNMLVRGPADSLEALEELKHPEGYAVDFDLSGIDADSSRGKVVLTKR